MAKGRDRKMRNLTEDQKVCPFFGYVEDQYDHCFKEECQLWTSAYTTENKRIFNCALVISAMKNSAGLVVV